MTSMETSNITRDFLKKMFLEGKRFDSRELMDLRNLELTFEVSNKAEGSARVKLGKTEVVVGIKLAIGEPYPDSPDKGNLICSGDLLPLASPRFESGPPKFRAIELPRLVDKAIRESGIIDFKKLSLTPGEKVWTVFIDIYPINDDGNLTDASTIGAMAALRNTQMPTLDKDGKLDYEKKSGPLPLSKEISPLSFSFFKLGDSIILDPTREEEEASEARITFGISKWEKQYMLNSCQKGGVTTFKQNEIEKIMSLLPKKFDELDEKIKKLI
jgi:exosome complex component RRP42